VQVAAERSHYEVLGVPRAATGPEVKKAWRARVLQVHPDQGGTARELIAVMEAFRILSNPQTRIVYDDATWPHETTTRNESSSGEHTSTSFDTQPAAGGPGKTDDEGFDIDAFLAKLSPELHAAHLRVSDIERTGGADRRKRIAAVWREFDVQSRNQHASRLSASGWFTCAGVTKKGLPCLARVSAPGQFCASHRQQRSATPEPLARYPRQETAAPSSTSNLPTPPPQSGSETALGCLVLLALVGVFLWFLLR
jgi:DnaJ domain